jgi:DNA-directed RNA polymerase subunit RPC12/RpoP
MPHSIHEEDLEHICAKCKKPHGDSITLKNLNHKTYEMITCQNCGYEIIKLKEEKEFTDKWDMFHRI